MKIYLELIFPDQIIKRLDDSKNPKEESKKICLELIESYRNINGVKGVHLMGHKKELAISEIIKDSKKIKKTIFFLVF